MLTPVTPTTILHRHTVLMAWAMDHCSCRVNLLCSLVRSNRDSVSKIQSTTNLITKCLHPAPLTRLKKPANSQTDQKMAQHLSHCNISLPSAPRFTRLLVSGKIRHPKTVRISCITQMAHKFTIKTNTTQHNMEVQTINT
jgi:hypothetical protein